MSYIPGIYDIFNKEWFFDVQSVYITSDTHFGEQDLKQAFSQRPEDDELVKRINSVCGRADCLIMLGDVGDISYIPKLRAKQKILILGNHDLGASNYQRQTWTKKFAQDQFQKDEALFEMKRLYPNCRYSINEGYQFTAPFDYWEVTADNKLFDAVFEGPVMFSEKLILSHEPIPNLTWAYNLHGHNHQGPVKSNLYHYNCALEVHDYTPTSFNALMKSGLTANIESLHRQTIDSSTERARKRGYTLKERKK